MNEVEEKEAGHRRNPLLLPLRFLLYWIIKAIVMLVLGIRAVLRPRPVRYGLVALLVVGVIGWGLAGSTLSSRSAATTGAVAGASPIPATNAANSADIVSVPATRQVDRSPTVEKYLKAQANFDANTMWDQISDDLKQQLATSNTSIKSLQDELDAAKQAGRQYIGATYIGGMQMDPDQTAYFYVLTVETSNGATRVPYIYVVGKDGKIVSIQ